MARGLKLMRIQDRRGPNRIRVLKVNPGTRLTLDVALANETIPGHERTTSMARRHDAIAAVNGDYTLLPSDAGAGRPVNLFAEDGDLVTSPLIWGRNFGITPEESFYFGHPTYKAVVTELDSGQIWKVKNWNEGALPRKGVAVYTADGGSTYPPPRNACSARLMPMATKTWRLPDEGVREEYFVDVVRCSSKALARRGGIVVAVPWKSNRGSLMQTSLVPGETVTVEWTSGWPRVLDTIGGNPTLIEDGVNVAEDCEGSYFCARNPRTAVGINRRGQILLVTVDGRQKRSVGMTLVQLSKLFEYLNATWALNMDGGGSTTMWVKGKGIVNRISGTSERPVGSALLVLPRRDPDEPVPGPAPTPSPTPTLLPPPTTSPSASTSASPSGSPSESPTASPSPTTVSTVLSSALVLEPLLRMMEPNAVDTVTRPARPCAVLRDPASTGGMLDALEKGLLTGHSVRLPSALERALGVFRGRTTCARFLRSR